MKNWKLSIILEDHFSLEPKYTPITTLLKQIVIQMTILRESADITEGYVANIMFTCFNSNREECN